MQVSRLNKTRIQEAQLAQLASAVIIPVQCHSRSLGTNRKPVCDLLL